MLFRQSAVSMLTRDTIVEEAARLPQDIYPAFIGSGEIALGLDATGLQGMNARTRQYRDTQSLLYGTPATQDDLYIRRDAALSTHEVHGDPLWNPDTHFHHLPCGWLDYVLTIDDEVYDTARLVAEGSEWSRQFSPLTGLVETSFRLGSVAITWQVGIAPDQVEMDCRFTAAAYDGRPRTLHLQVRCHQTTRAGLPLATGGVETVCDERIAFRAWDASTATATATILEPLRVTWALVGHEEARYEATEDLLAITVWGHGTSMRASLRVITGSDHNDTGTLAYAEERASLYRALGADEGISVIAEQWETFFESAADVHLGDPMKEFLVLQSQYLLRAGCSWRNGVPTSTLFTQAITPATSWDSFFTADGMLRCGHIALVRRLCAFLMRTAMPTGRPHYWMTCYNGMPVEANDQAYQVILAFGGIFMRLYACTRDRRDLEELAYPYLRRVAQYAFDELLTRTPAGWRLHGQVAHDVDTSTNVAVRQMGMLLWVAVCVSKCAAYAAELGIDDDLIALCRDLDAEFRVKPIDLSDPGMWGMWLPHLTAAEPLADFAGWARMAVAHLRQVTGKCYRMQPWDNFVMATSLSMTGQPDLALEVANDGLNSISGLGNLDEVTSEVHGGGWAPFPTSVGPWLSSVMIQFAHGTLWDDEVEVCTRLPQRLANQYLRWRGVTTLNGARVSGSYDPHHLDVTIETSRSRRVRLRVPARIAGEPLAFTLDGQPARCRLDGASVLVDLPTGSHTIVIARDLAHPAPVIVAEPMDHGRELVAVLAEAGHTVRWLRDYQTLIDLAPRAQVVVVHASYGPVPPDVVQALEAAVRAHGVTVIGLFHAGCRNVDRAFADLLGVRATFDGTERQYWETASHPVAYTLTAAGQTCLPGVPDRFEVPQSAHFLPDLTEDVTVLAVEADTGRPTVTLRRLGTGQLAWIASGGKTMDIGDLNAIHHAMKDLWLYGEDIQHRPDLKWLHAPAWHALLRALVAVGVATAEA